ncbi:MAG: hypothetical protein AUH05_21940 [Ktedonobacter sp. 13_2_20CM_53_11]|nr:MAG: hypothetical protein AUH05_21940 [Ktedonobacter sp. 13_2_20CM_53_11]
MIIFLLALIGTLIVMAILTIGRLGFGRREAFDRQKFSRWFAAYFVLNYILCLLILYFSEPALTGPFWGWQWLLWPLVISSIANLFAFARPALNALEDASAVSQGRSRSSQNSPTKLPTSASRGTIAAGIFGLVVAAVIGIVVSGLIVVFTTWFDSNAKALAAIPQVRTESSPKLPPTDQNHIVLVSKSIAIYKGQQVLGSNGQNLGSTYSIDPDSYTLQSINHHLYYVGPLSYNNVFANLNSPTTPGFVVVDAENPEQVPVLHTEASAALAFLPGALLNQDLLRHVYLNGYTYGKLVDPTLELDDSFHPYWTISLMQPSRGYIGDVLSEVLIVNAHTGEIKKYQPQNVPTWVDRVMPAQTVTDYLTWWGLYHAAPWFNPSGMGQQTPANDPELLYNNVDQPVWLIPMTSSSTNDQSSTGIFLFDTHKNEAHFYPLAGLGIGSNVQSTFQSNSKNIRNYNVASVQLYQIYGVPTWIAIYVQSSGNGGFQSVGVVDARNLNGSNVQYEASLPQALQDYQQWLTQQGNGGNTPSGGTTQTVLGKVLRISSVQQGSNTIYYIQISGQNTIFTANLSLSPKLPLVQPGDTIKGDYMTGGTVVNFKTFDDLTINLGGTQTPTTIPTGTLNKSPTPGPTPKH